MGEAAPSKELKPLTRAAAAGAHPLPWQEDDGKHEIDNTRDGTPDNTGDNFGESEIERARRLPLSPTRPRS
jgi:hypothetical protein